MLGALALWSAPTVSHPIPGQPRPEESGRAGKSVLGASRGDSPAAPPRNRASGTSRTARGSSLRTPGVGPTAAWRS
eukprot:6905943-Alexandrium_andersonii.AAC.1